MMMEPAISPKSVSSPRAPSPSISNTPDQAPPTAVRDVHPGVRRVHTLPPTLASHAAPATTGATTVPDSVETLFVHPSTRIVSFNVAGSSGRPSIDRRASIGGDVSGTLAWEYPSERTLAVGPLKMYRVPSSGVSFLNSGSFLHPILKRSQCWLVDEESKFVLRGRDGLFYRVELPFGNTEERELVEEFKQVLGLVLRYEKTPSPFRRGYVPEEVEPPRTPVKKTSKPREKAKRWRLNKVWEPEDPEHRAQWSPQNMQDEGPQSWRKHLRSRSAMIETSDSASSHETIEDDDSTTDESRSEHSVQVEPIQCPSPQCLDRVRPSELGPEDGVQQKVQSINEKALGSPQALPTPTHRESILPIRTRPDTMRSATAPPNLSIDTEPGASMLSLSRIPSRESDNGSIASSRDSFYSADEASLAAEAQERVPDLVDHAHIPTVKASRSNHSRQISEITVTPATPSKGRHSEEAREASDPSTPTLVSDTEDDDPPFLDAVTPPDVIRLRRIRNQASIASLNTGQPLETPRTPTVFASKIMSRRRSISAALLQKAYSLLVGPPSHLVSLMLDIAARIVRSMQSARNGGQRVPGAWNSSHADEEDEWEEEDDFGIPLDNLPREATRSRSRSQGQASMPRLSRTTSVASSDYDALIEGPMLRSEHSQRSSMSLD